MKCDICGKHEASLFIRRVVDGKAKELYVCSHCAKKHHLYGTDSDMEQSLDTVFEQLAANMQTNKAVPHDTPLPICPACGTSLKQVTEEGVIGCSLCFFYFRDTILEMIRSVNQELFYLGTLPKQLETFLEAHVPVQHLQKELEKAVQSENYELAAYFRDRIKEAESYS